MSVLKTIPLQVCILLFLLGCQEEENQPKQQYTIQEGKSEMVKAKRINSVPISLTFSDESLVLGMTGRSYFQNGDSPKDDNIEWSYWGRDSIDRDSGFIHTTSFPARLGSIRSFNYRNDSTIYVYSQGYFGQTKLWILDREGKVRDSLDLGPYLNTNPTDTLTLESLYAGPENPILIHDDQIEFQSLPYNPVLSEANKNKHFLSFNLGNKLLKRHPLSYPDSYYGKEFSYGYQAPFTSLIENETLIVGFQGSPEIFFFNLVDEKTKKISVNSPHLESLNSPPQSTQSIPEVKRIHGQYGPIYYIASEGVFVRQMFLPFESNPENGDNSLYFPHNRPSTLVVFDKEGQVLNKERSSVVTGLGQLGFFNPEDGLLYILRSKETDAAFEKGRREIYFAAFRISKLNNNS